MLPDIEFKVSGILELQDKFRRAQLAAQTHVGFEAIKEVKEHIDSMPWPPLSNIQGQIRGFQKLKTEGKPLSWCKNFLKFYTPKPSGEISLGVAESSKSIVGLLDRRGKENEFMKKVLPYSEKGGIIPITQRMRNFLAMQGAPIKKSTAFFNVPKRPILGILQSFIESKTGALYEKRLIERMK